MSMSADVSAFDPETVSTLKVALEDAWTALLPLQQKHYSKTAIASYLLELAAKGERDPERLRLGALKKLDGAG